MRLTGRMLVRCSPIWRAFVRGDIYELKAPRDTKGYEQRGRSFRRRGLVGPVAVVHVAGRPDFHSAREASFGHEIEVNGESTLVLVEQTAAVDPQRLGRQVGHVTGRELAAINAALRTVLDLN